MRFSTSIAAVAIAIVTSSPILGQAVMYEPSVIDETLIDEWSDLDEGSDLNALTRLGASTVAGEPRPPVTAPHNRIDRLLSNREYFRSRLDAEGVSTMAPVKFEDVVTVIRIPTQYQGGIGLQKNIAGLIAVIRDITK